MNEHGQATSPSLPARDVAAADLIGVQGTFAHTRATITSHQQRGDTIVVRQTVVGTLAGTLAGVFHEEVNREIHLGDGVSVGGYLTCTCTLGSQVGTLVLRLDGDEAPDGAFAGRFTVLSGTGELSALRGWGRFEGTSRGGMYVGQLFFAP